VLKSIDALERASGDVTPEPPVDPRRVQRHDARDGRAAPRVAANAGEDARGTRGARAMPERVSPTASARDAAPANQRPSRAIGVAEGVADAAETRDAAKDAPRRSAREHDIARTPPEGVAACDRPLWRRRPAVWREIVDRHLTTAAGGRARFDI
jgi:hypothetical protein